MTTEKLLPKHFVGSVGGFSHSRERAATLPWTSLVIKQEPPTSSEQRLPGAPSVWGCPPPPALQHRSATQRSCKSEGSTTQTLHLRVPSAGLGDNPASGCSAGGGCVVFAMGLGLTAGVT